MENPNKESGAAAGHVLIVEDSQTQAAQLQYILERHGFPVSVAANGREALTVLAGKETALVISDIIMPEMDGFELCRRIKASEETRYIPVILLTSLSDPQDVIKGLACGADNFITKPYDEDYLLARIGQMQKGRSHERSADNPGEMEVQFAGEKYSITSDRRRILDFLLSTYETAIRKNHELSRARDELNASNDQLETTVKELEAFSYTVSHDLRSPLTNIHGCCQVLLGMWSDRLDGDCLGFIRTIYGEAQRMNQLIATLLSFSRVASGELTPSVVNLSEMANAIAGGLRRSQPERRVTFLIADGITVNGDARLLMVVMENLLGNAWKYTGKKETPVIEFGTIEVAGLPACFVRDDGAGFDMTKADKLFVAFQRLHDRTEFTGFGIGLATVQRIIKRHGGRIWAEGEPGRGATFYFTLQ
jgi:two-component system sensor histidine kinase/response regulator